ncbi:MAG: sensor histidine kinase [Alphaproteobacteria bacterium]|nr:sensor histidine kinase [Alphaproteobacteria bacterium]
MVLQTTNFIREKFSFLKKIKSIKSPLVQKLLWVNLTAPLLLIAGLFYTGHYREGLISSEFKVLRVQAEILSVVLSESSVIQEYNSEPLKRDYGRKAIDGFYNTIDKKKISDPPRYLEASNKNINYKINNNEAIRVLNRLTALEDISIQLFDHNGILTAEKNNIISNSVVSSQTAFDYEEVGLAISDGTPARKLRYFSNQPPILSLALPVTIKDRIIGAILINSSAKNILIRLQKIKNGVFKLFIVALFITAILSGYIIKTIISPINRLSLAAISIKTAGGRRQKIPDESSRNDEIGTLYAALTKMTDTLWEKIDATERFAGDVSHELKNPIASIQSAVETIDYISDPEKKKKLMSIIKDDIVRMNILITDIANLSKLDAELSREEFEPVNIFNLLSSSIEIYNIGEAHKNRNINFEIICKNEEAKTANVLGMETRISQVFYNLIGNAISFSPNNSTISVEMSTIDDQIKICVNDQGPGIPNGVEKKLFKRFYCERPTQEQFGHHSGLGLSISQKIVTGLKGSIYAENRKDETGKILGACFTVKLPIIKGFSNA